jgi:SAM-dependent methyltransferase
MNPTELARLMAAYALSPEVQLKQTKFRCALVQLWKIPKGAKVLEIGCGQGDMTLALANAVGLRGKIVAIDSGPPSYGAPVNLGESAHQIRNGPLGSRIEFHFESDIISGSVGDQTFDVAVLAHSSWYFKTRDQLAQTLAKLLTYAPRLCISEWDLLTDEIEQMSHFLSVDTQARVEAYKPTSESNIRTLVTKDGLKGMLIEAGWDIDSELRVDSTNLDDGRWEVATCLANSRREASELVMPESVRRTIEDQVEVLEQFSTQYPIKSLHSFAISAFRAP